MSNYADLDKRRETQRKYREKNREKLREYYREKYGAEYKRQWREKKPDQRAKERASRKEYYERNREEERRKARVYMRSYYYANKERYSAYTRQRYLKMRTWFDSIHPDLKCSRCGESDRDCIDFHHKNPAERENSIISMLASRSKKVILEEVEKCLVLCANCHRKEHARLRREQASG